MASYWVICSISVKRIHPTIYLTSLCMDSGASCMPDQLHPPIQSHLKTRQHRCQLIQLSPTKHHWLLSCRLPYNGMCMFGFLVNTIPCGGLLTNFPTVAHPLFLPPWCALIHSLLGGEKQKRVPDNECLVCRGNGHEGSGVTLAHSWDVWWMLQKRLLAVSMFILWGPPTTNNNLQKKLQCTLFLHMFDLKPDNNGEKNAALHNVSNNIQKVESKSFYII